MIIGVLGLAGSGKSEVARILSRRFGCAKLAFADPLKTMLSSVGFTDAQLYGEEKSAHLAEFGTTPRRMMQTLGTEWGRETISPDIWVRLWARRLPDELAKNGRVVADDVRFPNEVRAIRDRGGFIIRVVHPDAKPSARWGALGRLMLACGLKWAAHPSERPDKLEADFVIFNDGTVEDLERKVAFVAQTAISRHVQHRAAEIVAKRARTAA